MKNKSERNALERNALEHKWRIGFGLLLLLLLLNAGVSLFNTQRLIVNTGTVNHSYRVLRTIQTVFSKTQDAETGVRGYVITGDEAFLEPYRKATLHLRFDLERLRFLTRDNPARAGQIALLERQVRSELNTLSAGIALFRAKGFSAVQSLTRTGIGKRQMDAIRRNIATVEQAENELLAQRDEESKRSTRVRILTFWVATLFNLALLSSVYFLLARDLAERRRVEMSLREATADAENANRAKSEFISSVSHELRTPLNAVIGFSKLLLNPRVGPLNEDQKVYSQDIVQSSEHLLQLINDILDISKVEAGKMTLDLAPFDLAELLHSSLGIVREKARQENLRLEAEFAPEITEMPLVVADRRKIKQVVYNLLSNAVKFTPEGGAVTVSARPARPGEFLEAALPDIVASNATRRKRSKTHVKKDANAEPTPAAPQISHHLAAPRAVVISVRDTGIGIPLDQQARVFGAFEQIDSSYARQQAGTGLGLALTKRMVELHGGTVWLESEEGRGSTFSFSLPLRAHPPQEPDAPATQQKPRDNSDNIAAEELESARTASVATV